jgi:hypothetical protein
MIWGIEASSRHFVSPDVEGRDAVKQQQRGQEESNHGCKEERREREQQKQADLPRCRLHDVGLA